MSHQLNEKDHDSLLLYLLRSDPLPPAEALDWIEALTSNARSVQLHVLRDILTLNSDAEYLRKLGLHPSSPPDPLCFKRIVPVITYKDIQPLIARIADGDKSPILTSTHPISEFFSSSGTSSGQPKLIPTHDAIAKKNHIANSLPAVLMRRNMQELGLNHDGEGLSLFFLFVKPEFTTQGGLPVRTFVTRACKNPGFRAYAKATLTSPIETVLCEDVSQSMYCQLFCGLIHRSKVDSIGVVFASGFLRVVRFFQEWWQEIVEDIRMGTLSKRAVSDAAARVAVEELIAALGGPNATLARFVEEECERQPRWEGIVRRLWPKAKYVSTVLTGAMATYVSTVEFYAGSLPLVSPFYSASECYMGVNITPLCKPSEISYMLLPNMAYFEFIPVFTEGGLEAARLKLVDLVDVKVGEQYEIVVTTYAGLYRYRMGDVVRVMGFHNRVPLVQFVGRRNVLLSIDVEKTEEETLQTAIRAAMSAQSEQKDWWLVDYTSFADVSTVPGHYVLFWEVCHVDEAGARGNGELMSYPGANVLQECCLVIEENLDSVYRRGRVLDKSIGPLEIRVVTAGTFDAVMEFLCVEQGSSYSQYKTPRCVNKERHASILELLNARVLSSVCSPKCPSWELPKSSLRRAGFPLD